MAPDFRGMNPPTHYSAPEYYKTFGPDVAEFCRAVGYAPDPEQELALNVIFGRKADGRSACFEVATVVGRQNLKTGLFMQCLLGWLYFFGDMRDMRLLVYSAHEFSTAMEAFRQLVMIVESSPDLRGMTRKIIRNHGEEAVENKWGCRAAFKTRTKGGGRGLSGNKVILDEGMFLQEQHMGSLLPTLSAQKDPQVLYGSSAGLVQSAVLRDVRNRGRKGGEPTLGYLEWCAPDPSEACDAGGACTHSRDSVGCGCDKPDLWLMGNPAIGKRRANGTGLSFEYIQAERRALPPMEFCRERMGWWDESDEGIAPLSVTQWTECGKDHSRPDPMSVISVGIDISPDSAVAAIGVAAWRTDELPHVELAEHLPGTGWLLDRILGITARRNPVAVVINPAGPAGAFERHLRNHDFITLPDEKMLPPDKHRLVLTTGRALAQACGAITNAVTNLEVRHPDQAPLNRAVADARTRPVVQAWAFSSAPGGDITPLVAVTLAYHGLLTYGKKEPPEPFVLT